MKNLLAILFLFFYSNSYCQNISRFKDGDIIFQTSLSSQSLAIQAATKSKWSHMGIIFFIKGNPYVFEAASVVTLTPLKAWINRGKGRNYAVKRLREREKYITASTLIEMKRNVKAFQGRSYDSLFDWSDKQMYCSELVWKVYYQSLGLRLAELQSLRDFDLRPAIVRKKLKERYGKHIPYDEPVISPEQIFQSDLLVTVR
jgi:hypothetical protein